MGQIKDDIKMNFRVTNEQGVLKKHMAGKGLRNGERSYVAELLSDEAGRLLGLILLQCDSTEDFK